MIERDDAFLLLAESTVPCKLCTMQALFHALHLHLAAHLHLHLAQALFHALHLHLHLAQALFLALHLHLHLVAHLHLHLAQALFHASQHTEAAHSQCNI